MPFISILLSGGIESVVATTEAAQSGATVRAMHFNTGADSEAREIAVANQVSLLLNTHLKVVDFPGLQQMFSGIMDPENLMGDLDQAASPRDISFIPAFLGLSLTYARQAGADAVIAGLTKEQLGANGERALQMIFDSSFLFDQRPIFTTPKLVLPFKDMTKAQVIERGVELKVAFDRTWSCLRGGVKHCGICPSCFERKAAFKMAHVEDPTSYLS